MTKWNVIRSAHTALDGPVEYQLGFILFTISTASISMIPKRLEEILYSDIEGIVSSELRESKTVEYKRDLPGNSESQKKEFLYDVSSFANTVGGDLIIGVEEENGVPSRVTAVKPANIDEEIQRMDSILISGLEPRIRYHMRAISHPQSGYVLVLRIERNGLAPHRVIYKDSDKFYARNSAGKYPLDVAELREAFLLGASAADRLREFRVARLASIAAGEGPVLCEGDPILVIHLIPLQAFTSQSELDIAKYYNTPIMPIGCYTWSCQINIDGVLHYAPSREDVLSNYVQVYRSGIIEIADEFAFSTEKSGNKIAPLKAIERRINQHLPQYINCMKEIGATPPVFMFLSIVGATGCRAYIDHMLPGSMDYPRLKRDPLMLPEISIDDLSTEPSIILKPVYDRLWNAFGLPGSPS